jgi:hypothetical protein
MIAPGSLVSRNPSTTASATASGRPGMSNGLMPISGSARSRIHARRRRGMTDSALSARSRFGSNTIRQKLSSVMANLPSPARALTLSAINADYEKYLAELEQGGAILVYSDDRQALLGVLTRDPAVLGDARLAQQIEAGNLPPLEELLERAVDDPAA